MTLQELSQHLKLREQLAQDEEILESLEAAACPGARALTGMPRTPGVRDRVGDFAVAIADMQERIKQLREEIDRTEGAVEGYISAIEDDRTRMIFRLRFICCLTWSEVAAIVGGKNTEDGVKSACYRYVAAQNRKDSIRH